MRDSKVATQICKEYNNEALSISLKQCFDLLGGLSSFIKPSHTVLIKPDLYYATEPNEAKTTNPHVVVALAELIAKIGAKCIIADSPRGDFKHSVLDNAYLKTQMLEASNDGHATLNINENVAVINNPNGEHCREIYVIDAVNDADVIINVGKLRCDKYLGLVGCGQNLFGLIPGKMKEVIKARCHNLKTYYNYSIDLYEALENKIILNLLDGVVGSEANDEPRILNALIVGQNPYSVDATALKIINQDPSESLLLCEAERRNKYNSSFENLGDNINSLICPDFHYSTFYENIAPGSEKSFKNKYNRTQKRPIISQKLCKGCTACTKSCPMNAITMSEGVLGKHAVIDYSKCISCFKCLQSCPYKIVKTKNPLKHKSIDKKIQKALKK
ncbi:MAG: DUF362 domain-containing protein [Clostridia bacterium]|nr:DUF362 domain-containing protein [Clostridia bacterium]